MFQKLFYFKDNNLFTLLMLLFINGETFKISSFNYCYFLMKIRKNFMFGAGA